MGGGVYSSVTRAYRATTLGYDTKTSEEIFTQRSINNAMNPHKVTFREARDSKEHPFSVPIILALDVTGSMGSIPHYLVKEGLPKMMDGIIQAGIEDPQVLFMGIGDHECDDSPLQVGQFESSDELLDKWLTDVYLEGGGGGNDGESYHLAWYFAGYHTVTDSWEKRDQKGFLFTVGDEPVLERIPGSKLQKIMGFDQYNDQSALELLDKARESYHVYHLHIKETMSGSRSHVINGWKELMSDNLIIVNNKEDVAKIIAETVVNSLMVNTTIQEEQTPPSEESQDNELIL